MKQIDPKTKKRVAIKKGYIKNHSQFGMTATFIREIGTLKELALYNHKNIVRV